MIKPLIIDVKSGNILSLKNILSNINNDVVISNNEDEIKNCTHIFLPGVGNYSNVMEKLKKMINISFLKDQITNKKKTYSRNLRRYANYVNIWGGKR